jgi:DNA-directed RNA polymerase subunit N (RpoN/RPB10)
MTPCTNEVKAELDMDNLADTPLVCFSCGRPIAEGSHFVCVNRLLRIKGASAEDRIQLGMASLQICSLCAAKAREEEIIFNEIPVPLLNLEKAGFYSFVRNLELSSQPQRLATGADKCYFCGTPIIDGKHYVHVDMNIQEIRNRQCKVLPSSTLVLAVACEECAERYMIWL